MEALKLATVDDLRLIPDDRVELIDLAPNEIELDLAYILDDRASPGGDAARS